MAQTFQEVFGEMLISAPLDKNEKLLPSPEKLKRKIILKHKKLPEGVDENTKISVDMGGDNVHGMDISNSVQSGILYLQDSGKNNEMKLVKLVAPLLFVGNMQKLMLLHRDWQKWLKLLVTLDFV